MSKSITNILTGLKFPPLIFSTILAILGLLTLASLSSGDEQPFLIFQKQAIWYLGGLIIFWLINRYFDYRLFYKSNFFSVGVYLGCLILLGVVLILGEKVKGAAGWFNFGWLSFQPAELAKLSLLILLSRYLAIWHIEIWRPWRIIVSIIYTGVPFLLIFLQPDLGSAIIFIILWIGMIVVAGLRPKHFLILLLVGSILAIAGWHYFLAPYQKERISAFFNPGADPLGSGYNVIQSKIAIGSGGWFGLGLGRGVETQLKFLPEAKTDFFIAAFIEEWGFFGALILAGAFIGFIFSIGQIGLMASDNFARLFVFGYLLILVFQIIINFGANLGFLPITGLPLPFLSYGGSNLLFQFLSLGIISSIKKRSF